MKGHGFQAVEKAWAPPCSGPCNNSGNGLISCLRATFQGVSNEIAIKIFGSRNILAIRHQVQFESQTKTSSPATCFEIEGLSGRNGSALLCVKTHIDVLASIQQRWPSLIASQDEWVSRMTRGLYRVRMLTGTRIKTKSRPTLPACSLEAH